MKIFLYEEKKAVLEQCNPDGTLQDHFEGRQLNPGHAIESSWFILREAIERDNDKNLIELAIRDYLYIYYNILCFPHPLFLIPARLQALSLAVQKKL